MKKIFKYSEEQEKVVDAEFGYTEKQLNNVCAKKQYQFTLGVSEISHFFKVLKKKECDKCGTKLKLVKECTYVGLRHPPQATGGSYEKTYHIVFKRYCPQCKAIIE